MCIVLHSVTFWLQTHDWGAEECLEHCVTCTLCYTMLHGDSNSDAMLQVYDDDITVLQVPDDGATLCYRYMVMALAALQVHDGGVTLYYRYMMEVLHCVLGT